MSPESRKIRIAAIGDLHVQEHSFEPYKDLFQQIAERADVLLVCGDITNTGLPREAENLTTALNVLNIPVLGVLGNHDHHSDQVDQIKQILSAAKFKFLEDEVFRYEGIGFAGVKGFGGGFDSHVLGFFGEPATKAFVTEAVNESLRLENALKLIDRMDKKVVVLHYSPIAQTIEGEPKEIYPYLGSSRFADVLDRFENIKLVVHGHAHHAAHSGRTLRGVPVYNVSHEVMKKTRPDHPYLVFEI